MCTYISVTLPKSANLEACRGLFETSGLALDLMESSGAPGGVLSTENYYFTCAGHCDCGTSIGSACTEKHVTPDTHEDTIRKSLRAKGWSETKIKRRRQELEKTAAKNERANVGRAAGSADEINQWLALTNDVLNGGHAMHFGVTVNDYAGSISNPKFTLNRVAINKSNLTPASLERLSAATLLVVS